MTTPLPELNWHDHPDFPSMKWTDLEIRAIKKYAIAAIEAATLAEQGKRKPLTDDDIQAIIKMLERHQTFNYEPDCPVVAMSRKLKNMLDGITATPQGKI